MANFLGRLQTFLFGAAVGRAAADSITPVLEPVRQHAWEKNQVRVLDPNTAAESRVKGIISEADAEGDAARGGIGVGRFGVLLRLAQTWPGLSELASLSNRQFVGTADVIEALTRHGYPGDLVGTVQTPGPLVKLFQEILSPGELAAAIHRGLVPDPGILLGEQPSGPRKVESYPVQPIDAVAEAAGSGYDKERLSVLVGLQGLPMGVIEAAHAYWRGIITHGDYIAAFNESNNRNEWAEAVLEYSRQIPTARDFMENALRGHHDFDWAAEQAARHGMERDDAFIIYQNQGRPLNLHQISQALAWGAKYNPGPGDNPDPWMQAVLLGAVRPEYYEMQDKLRYIVPSVFAIRSLAESGVWDETKTAARLKQAGWIPEDADQVAKAWTTSTAATKADPYIGKAETQLWTAIHKAYVKDQTIDDVRASALLTNLVPAQADIQQIIDLWTIELQIVPTPPTP